MNSTSSNLKVLAIVATNSGGEGKTLIARMLESVAFCAGLGSVVLDADPGNAAFLEARAGAGQPVPWCVPPSMASKILDHNADNDVIIADVGANALASGAVIGDTILELIEVAKSRNIKPVVLIPVTPQKAGAVGTALDALNAFAPRAETRIVMNDRDGSSTFDSRLPNDALKVAHLQPAFQALLNSRPDPVHAFIDTDDDYSEAGDVIANWLAKFANDPFIEATFGKTGLRQRAAPFGYFHMTKLADAENEKFARNIRCATSMRLWIETDANDTLLDERGREVHAAFTAYLTT